MMFALNALLLAGILIAVGVLLYLRMSRRLPEQPDEKPVYTLEAMTAFVKEALLEMTSSNLIDFGLSEEEYRRRKNKRAELKKALRGCTSGDLRDKAYVKQVIADLLEQRYTLDDKNLNLLLPFDDPKKLSPQDQYDILLFLFKKQHRLKALDKLIRNICSPNAPSGSASMWNRWIPLRRRWPFSGTPDQLGQKSRERVAVDVGTSATQVQRYIRLTELIPPLLEMVDNGKVAFSPAVELSYLSEKEQEALLETMGSEDRTPSLSQAQRMKKLSADGLLDVDAIFKIMTEEKPNQREQIKLQKESIKDYFPKGYTTQQMEQTIFKLLEEWQKKRERSREDTR
ncbi:MAG TPA: hypothetical protein VF268_16485 [Gammaproteobacteria bacterium]